ASTNLNLVTASGTVYSFLLTEKNGGTPDLKVYVSGETTTSAAKPKYYSGTQVEQLESQVEALRSQVIEARAAVDATNRRSTEAIAAYQQRYPARLQFVYGTPKYDKPFLVRAIWHDGQFTYLKAEARELPALYEIKDGAPALVNFQVHDGTYVVPKVLDRGYLALGKERFVFAQQGR